MNGSNLAEVKTMLESAMHSENPRAAIMAIVARSANLPKPLLAAAYLQLQRIGNDQLQAYAQQALTFVESLDGGTSVRDALSAAGLPAELEILLRSYGANIRPADD